MPSRRRAGVGRSVASVCLRSEGKRLELSTPNFIHIYSIVVARYALTHRSKGQGHVVASGVCCLDRAAAARLGLNVNTTVYVF